MRPPGFELATVAKSFLLDWCTKINRGISVNEGQCNADAFGERPRQQHSAMACVTDPPRHATPRPTPPRHDVPAIMALLR